MSRSQPQPTNPAQHFFEWKGGTGTLEFYDKELEKRITIPLPFEFLPLDQLATITGFSKLANSSYYSNEVRNTAKEPFTVKLKGQIVFTGIYKNDQGIVQIPKGAVYAKSIYVAHKTKTGEYIIDNLKASGSALGAWIEFGNKYIPENGKVTITKGEMQTSPVGNFYPPVFTYSSSTAEEDREAIRLDQVLQTYLKQYFTTPNEEEDSVVSNAIDDSSTKATSEQVADFKDRKSRNLDDDQSAINRQRRMDTVIEYIGDEPINLDDIPF